MKLTSSLAYLLAAIFISVMLAGCGAQGATVEGELAAGKPNQGAYVLLCKVADAATEEPVCKLDPKLSAITDEAGNFTLMGKLPKTNSTNAILSHKRTWFTADATSVICSNSKFWFSFHSF